MASLLETVAEAIGFTEAMPPTPFIYNKDVEAIWPKGRKGLFVDRLLTDVRDGKITQRDLLIAETLFRHRYLTGNHMNALFFSEVKDRKFIRQKLEKLENLRIISHLNFKVNGKPAKTKIYFLDEGGAALLKIFKQMDIGDWSLANNIRHISYIFRLLMTNEVFVKLWRLTKKMSESVDNRLGLGAFELEPVLKCSGKNTLEPTAKFNFAGLDRNGEMKFVNFFVEVLRGSEIEYLPTKLRKYNDWYLTTNPDKKTPPILFMVTEREHQSLQVSQTMSALGLNELQKWCRYSTDNRLGNEPLDKAFFNVQKGEIIPSPVSLFLIDK